MGELGADPVALRDAARLMRTEQARLRHSGARVTARVHAVRWQGHDARRFRSAWKDSELRLRAALSALGDTADALDHQAAEQETASGEAAPGGTTATTTPSNVKVLAAAVPMKAGGMAAMTSTPGDPGRPPFGEPLPVRSESWSLGAGIATALGVSGAATLTVDELPGGRSMVWIADRDAVSASGGVSAGVAIDSHAGIQVGADATAELGLTTRQGWIIDSDDLAGMLTRLGLRELAGGGMISPGIPGSAGALGGLVLGPLVDLVGLDAPDPGITDHLVGLRASAGAVAAAAVPVIGVSGAVEAAVGIRERPRGPSILVELRGRYGTEGAMDATGLAQGPSGDTTITLEVPTGETAAPLAVVTRTQAIAGGQVTERSVHTFESTEAIDAARRAVLNHLRGDPTPGTASLAALWKSIDADPVWSDARGGVLDDDVHSIDAGAAIGAEVSASVSGGRRVVTYQR